MPKQIKFNLIIDEKPVRDVEGLLENFNIEDLLDAYKNGSLKRWLLVRGKDKEAGELDKIKGDALEAASALCRIFIPDCTEEQLKQAAYPFESRQKFEAELKKMESLKNQRAEIILSYHDGYDKLLDAMEANGDNYAFLKAAINDIFQKFRGLYHLDIDRFYKRFISKYPLVILTLLANRSPNIEPLLPKPFNEVFKDINISSLLYDEVDNQMLQNYFTKWGKGVVDPKIEHCSNSPSRTLLARTNQKIVVVTKERGSEIGNIYSGNKIVSLPYPFNYFLFSEVTSTDNKQRSPSHVKVFSDETDDFWKDLETEGKWMIIQMANGNIVRSHGKTGEELKAGDVNGKFPVLEGINYKHKPNTDQLIYMEV